jgi:hypothetical protein
MRVLPFAVYSEPTVAYPEAMEAAVTLLTIDGRRAKGTGLLSRKTEQIAWISKFLWPLLALPVDMPTLGDGDDLAPANRKLLFFDLTGLAGSAVPAFAPREALEISVDATAADLPVVDYTAMVERFRDTLRQARPPLTSALSAVKGLVRRGPSGGEVAGFLSGHTQLARELLSHLTAEPEPPEWSAPYLATQVSLEDAERIAAEVADQIRAHLGQATQIEALGGQLRDGAGEYPVRLADERQRIASDYNSQIDAIRPEVDRAIAEHQQGLEDRINSINAQFSSTIAAQEANLSRLGQSDDRRAQVDARRQLDATIRERDNATKQARDQYRSLIDKENEKIGSLNKARDREISVLDAAEKRLLTAIDEMQRAVDAAAGQDRKAAGDLADFAVEPAEPELVEAGPIEFCLPLYVARLDGPKPRYLPLLPLTLKRTRSLQAKVGGLVSGLLGGVTLPSEQRYEGVLGRALSAALDAADSPGAAGAEIVASIFDNASGSNVLGDGDFLSLALEGLAALREGNWLNDKQLEEQRQALQKLFV